MNLTTALHALRAPLALVLAFGGLAGAGAQAPAQPAPLPDMARAVAEASRPAPAWAGPRTGPAGQLNKTVVILAEDLRNGGILGVAQGVREAARLLQWHIKVLDAAGTPAGRSKAAADAIAARPDGLVLVGADAHAMQGALAPLAQRGVPIVGWHVGAKAGPVPGSAVAMNVSTDPLEVARITAMAAVVGSGGRAQVVIFTDSNYEIAIAKAQAMAEVIRACKACALLEWRDVAIARSAELMPGVTRELLAKHSSRWTHALAINDLYFDYAVPELIKAGPAGAQLKMLSAGDGSPAAFMRIQAGTFQTGTVAEPLNLHGWQLADELNRLLAGQPVSGHVVAVHLVDHENVAFDGGPRLQYDPDNGYREHFRRIWQVSLPR